MAFDLGGKRVWVAGHRGMVGSAIVRRLAAEDCAIITAARGELDLLDQAATFAWLARHRPQAVFVAAAKVGGILANATRPGEFLYENLVIQANIIEGARRAGVEKTMLLGSSCSYPRLAPQPIREDALLTGALEPANEAYAIAKIAGIKLAQAYRQQHGCDIITAMPTNLYGIGDNFDPVASHVLPALIRKAHEAKLRGGDGIAIWGTGAARREFLFADDCADACVFLMRHYAGAEPVNVGCGEDLPVIELARLVCEIVGIAPNIRTDPTRPDGPPRKLLDMARLRAMGWAPLVGLREGIARTYRWYCASLTGAA